MKLISIQPLSLCLLTVLAVTALKATEELPITHESGSESHPRTKETQDADAGPPAPKTTSAERPEESDSDRAKRFSDKRAKTPLSRFPELDMAERQQLREALQGALGDPAVAEAREELRAASENFKQTLRSAITEENPELAPTLHRMLEKKGPGRPPGPPQGPHGNRTSGPLWKAEKRFGALPENPVDYLQGDLLRRALDSQRQQLRQAHLQAIEEPAVREAIEKLAAANPSSDQRPTLRTALRNSYLDAMEKHLPGLRMTLRHGPSQRHGAKRPAGTGPALHPDSTQ